MTDSHRIEAIWSRYNLKSADVYLLELIPLIEMMWADGQNQPEEMSLLYQFAVEHVAWLSRATGGATVVTVDDVNYFLDRFAHERPPAGLLAELRELASERAARNTDADQTMRHSSILEYCLEIAAACRPPGPDADDQRIVDAERKLLLQLMRAFDVEPTRLVGPV